MAKRIYGPDTSAYAGAGTGRGPALVKPEKAMDDPLLMLDNQMQVMSKEHEKLYNQTAQEGRDPAPVQTAWNSQKLKFLQRRGQVEMLQRIADSGGLTPERAKELQYEVVSGINLPQEQQPTLLEQRLAELDKVEASGLYPKENIDRARLELQFGAGAAEALSPTPKPEPRGRFSARDLGYGDLMGLIEEHQAEGLNPDGSYNPVLMKQQYFRARQSSFYGQMNSAQRREWEVRWLKGMYDPEMLRRWKLQVKTDPDLYTSHIGPDSTPTERVMQSKVTGTKTITPAAQHIADQLPKPKPVEDFTTMSVEELARIAGGM